VLEVNSNNNWLNKDYIYRSIVYATKYIPFYQKYNGISIFNIYDILPLISKNDLVRNVESFSNIELPTSKIIYSSGFSSGIRTPVAKSVQEVDFANTFFKNIEREDIYNVYLHYSPAGDYMVKLKNLNVINLHEIDVNAFTFFNNLKEKSFLKPLRIIGLESQLRLFTLAMLQSEPGLNIHEVISGGDLITENLYSFYQKRLCRNFTNRFGITELFGGATKCYECGLFHFDEYTIFDVTNKVTQGEYIYGDLILSSTYPFSQKVFLLKYLTGDYVGIKYCFECKKYGIKLLGRKKNLLFNKDELIFSSNDLYDRLDNFIEIAKSKLFTNNIFKINPYQLGHLRFQYYKKGYDIILVLVLWDSKQYNVTNLKDEILNAINDLILVQKFKFVIEITNESSSISAFLPDEIED
jgi:phenylacetate-coenzyme A ligase PaaK-like adenylate-forming protein